MLFSSDDKELEELLWLLELESDRARFFEKMVSMTEFATVVTSGDFIC